MSPIAPPEVGAPAVVLKRIFDDVALGSAAPILTIDVEAPSALQSADVIVFAVMFPEAIVIAVGKAPVANLDKAMAASLLTSASTITPDAIAATPAEEIVMSPLIAVPVTTPEVVVPNNTCPGVVGASLDSATPVAIFPSVTAFVAIEASTI